MYEGEFIEWIRLYCSTSMQQRNGMWDMLWHLTEEEHPWDGKPRRFFSTDELYNHWKQTINKK